MEFLNGSINILIDEKIQLKLYYCTWQALKLKSYCRRSKISKALMNLDLFYCIKKNLSKERTEIEAFVFICLW